MWWLVIVQMDDVGLVVNRLCGVRWWYSAQGKCGLRQLGS